MGGKEESLRKDVKVRKSRGSAYLYFVQAL